MKQSEILTNKLLHEADIKVSQQIVDKAIKEGKSILIAKTQKNNNNTLESNIIMKPTEIQDDLVLGTTEKDNQPFQANLTDVVSIMNEDLRPAIDSDSNHEIVEEENNENSSEASPEIQKLYDESFSFSADWKNSEELVDSFTEAAKNFGIERFSIGDMVLFIKESDINPQVREKLKRTKGISQNFLGWLTMNCIFIDLVNDHIESIIDELKEKVTEYWGLGVSDDLICEGSDQYCLWLSPRTLTDNEVKEFDKIQREEMNLEDNEGIITEEELTEQDSPKELAIYNIKNWVNELNLDLGNQTRKGDLTSFTLNTRGTEDRLKEQPTVYIYPEGGIMISGHRVKTFKDLSLIINFLKDTNS